MLNPTHRDSIPTVRARLRCAARTPIIASLIIASVMGASRPAMVAAAGPPDIVVILADDLGYSDLGCYGGEIATPNLDRLAKRGLRFTQFYNTARCWPTRAALLTGFYAQQVRRDVTPGVPGGGHGTRPPWGTLVSQTLNDAGYRCYHSGKWHLDGKPLQNGFDASYWLNDYSRYFDPKRHFLNDRPLPSVVVSGDADSPDGDYYNTDAITDYMIAMIDDHDVQVANDSNDVNGPMFAYVAYEAPHFPLMAPADDVSKYAGRYDAGWDVIRSSRHQTIRRTLGLQFHPAALEPKIGPPYHFDNVAETFGDREVDRELAWDSLTPIQREFQSRKMEIHAAMVDRMDQNIGRLIERLERRDRWNDTLVIFLSDNGASAELMVRGDGHRDDARMGGRGSYVCLGPGWSSCANAPFRRHKTWVHEGGIRTPMIVRMPPSFEMVGDPGSTRRSVGHVVDWVPTFLAMAGVDDPPAMTASMTTPIRTGAPQRPGRSLLPVIRRDVDGESRTLWWLHEGNRALRRIDTERNEDFKIVAAKGDSWSLYDMNNDPTEQHDLAGERPDMVERLELMWQSHTDQTAALFR